MKTKIASVICVLTLISFLSFSQRSTKPVSSGEGEATIKTEVVLTREIKLEATSESKEVTFEIGDDIEKFEFVLSSLLTAGQLKIDVLDPKNKNRGTYVVGSQLESKWTEKVKGIINTAIKSPEAGVWKVVFSPGAATGRIAIESHLTYSTL